MKIALLANGLFPFTIGGMQKESYCLSKYLARMGVDVDLYFTIPENGPEPDISLDSLFTEDEARRLSVYPIRYPRARYFPGHYLYDSYVASNLIWNQISSRTDVDFIYAQGFTGWKALKAKSAGHRLPPIGVHFHGLEMYQPTADLRSGLQALMFRPFVENILQRADFSLSYGGLLDTIIVSRGVPDNRIIHSVNGISSDWMVSDARPPSNPLRFVFVGRYERRKGVRELSQAIGRLQSKIQFRFDFIGPIPDGERVSAENIRYHGLVRDEESIRSILRQSDILVSASYSEGMPTVILEGMASGLGIIATDVGAVRALVSGDTGWLIQSGSVSALEQAISAAVDLPRELLFEKKRNALELVRRSYVWERVAEETAKNISNALASAS